MSLLATASEVIDISAWQTFIDAMTAQINVATVVGVMTALMTLGVGGVFMWWGLRKAMTFLRDTTFKGKFKG